MQTNLKRERHTSPGGKLAVAVAAIFVVAAGAVIVASAIVTVVAAPAVVEEVGVFDTQDKT